MDLPLLIVEFSSRNVSRIRGACAEVMACWDRAALAELAAHVPEIRAATEGLEWGGMFLSNAEHLHNVIRRMEHARSSDACFCQIYTMFAGPEREQDKGHVTIHNLDKEKRAYEVTCNHCGARYRVEENDYHYTWWQWTKVTS